MARPSTRRPPLRLPLLLGLGAGAASLRQRDVMLELLDVARTPPVEDDGALHVATVSCRSCAPVIALVKSLAAQAKLEGGQKPSLHLFTDRICGNAVNALGRQEPGTIEAMDVHMYNINSVPILPSQKTPHGKTCTMVRLFLPRLFPLLHRLLYLDADTLVLNSLWPLWKMDVPVIAMADNDRKWFQVNAQGFGAVTLSRCPKWRNGTRILLQGPVPGEHPKCWAGHHGLNAGVMLINLVGWRAHNFDRDVDWWSEQVYKGEVDMLMNDQDIINIMLVPQEDRYYRPLPCEANLRFADRWMCLFTPDGTWASWDAKKPGVLLRNKRTPMVLHSKFGKGTISQQWSCLFLRTLDLARRVNVNGLRNGSSLCAAVDCQRMILEESYSCDRCQPGWVPSRQCLCSHVRDFVEDQTFPHTGPLIELDT